MRKIQVKAEQTLFDLPNEQWYVHSIFKHTFNMMDRKHMPLILIATDQKNYSRVAFTFRKKIFMTC